MNTAVAIPGKHIVINWLITVVAGSITWPLLALTNPFEGEVILLYIVVSIFASALTSFPAMLLLLETQTALNKRKMSLSRHCRIHMLVHLAVSAATFLFLSLFGFFSNGSVFLLPVTYTAIGLMTSLLTYMHYNRNRNLKPVKII